MSVLFNSAKGGFASTRPKDTLWQRIWKERTAYLLVLPPVIGFLVFFAYPVVIAFIGSFTKFDSFTMVWRDDPLYNYRRAFRDPMVLRSMLNALYLFAISWTSSQVASLSIALAINSLRRGVGLFRTLYYIPMVTSIVTVATIFRWLFGGDPSGPMNQLLSFIGLSPVRWLWDENIVIPIIGSISVWVGLGFNIVIWTAGLKGIPVEYYEAARIDGASSWRQFWSITLPLLKPVIIFQAITGFIGGMKEFGLVLVMTQGGPSGASTTPVLMIYKYGFQQLQMGYASAIAWLLSAFLLIATVLQFRLYGRTESYE